MAKPKQRKPADEKPPAPVAKKPVAETPVAKTPSRRDVRPFLYAGLDLLFGVLYVIVFLTVARNRHPWAMAILWALPVAVLGMGVSTVLGVMLRGPARRYAWIAAVASGTIMLLVTVLLLALLLASAAFLSGVYGSFGKAAASGALAGAALIVEVVGLLPAFQLKYLLTRAGRRAFGQPPLWRKAATA